MAKGKPPAKPFQKGVSGNPGGRKRMPEDLRQFRETTYQDFLRNLQRCGAMSKDQLLKEVKRPDATMFELMFANIVRGAAEGEKDARQLLLDRLWGKVKETMDISHTNIDERLQAISKDKITQLLKEASNG